MGLPHNLGRLSPAITSDASLNIGIGVTPSGTYKLEVNGTVGLSGALTGTSALFSTSTNGIVSVNRGSSSFASLFKMSTAGVDNWAIGIPTLSTADWVLYNYATSSSNLSFSSATGAATFSSSIAATSATFTGILTTGSSSSQTPASISTNSQANQPALTLFKNIFTGTGEDVFRIQSFTSGVVNVFTVKDNGATAISGALSGTSATFSGNVTLSESGSNNHNLIFNQLSGSNNIFQGIDFKDGNNLIRSAIKQEQTNFATGLTDLVFYNGATSLPERMRLFSSGNFAIGTSTDAGFKLDVNGTGRFSGAANALSLRSTSATTMWTEYYYNTTTLSGYIGSGSGILSGANNSDFIIRSEADFVVATGGNNRRLTIASTGAATFSGALTMSAYSFASSAIQFTRAATNTIAPASGNGILVFAGGNAQIRMDTSNSINFDVNNSGNPFAPLSIRQTGNTVSINSLDNGLALEMRYQNVAYGYFGSTSGFSGAALAYSVNGGYVYLSSSSTWIAASDRNRKKNFEGYNRGLSEICNLKPTLFNLRIQSDDEPKIVGLIAQEVGEHIPEAFSGGEFVGIDYNALTVTIINAIKEQQAQIEELKLLIK